MTLDRFALATAQLWCECRGGRRAPGQLAPMFRDWLAWRRSLGRPFVASPRQLVRVVTQGTMENGEAVALTWDGCKMRALVLVVENDRVTLIKELDDGRANERRLGAVG